MKYFAFFLILIFTENCMNKKDRAMEAYIQFKKLDIKPFFNFGMDTRGINDSGKAIVRSIRYYEFDSSTLIYHTRDTVALEKFCKKYNLSYPQLDTVIDVLLKQQSSVNTSEIGSSPRLGEFVYYVFSKNDKILVYCPNVQKVYNQYWKTYITDGIRVDSSWYIIHKITN
jgi:hypothetical protein